MKRLISVLLCTALVFGLLSIFPVKTYAFSGGSGTEEDPYLISTVQDLYELRKNIKSEPRSWLKKQHYKLTANINFTNKGTISPLYDLPGYGFHCFEKTGYTVDYFFKKSIDEVQEWYDLYQAQYGYLYANSYTKGFLYEQELSYLRYYDYRVRLTADEIKTTVSIPYEDKEYGSAYYEDFYRKIPFLGTFDGNGYTITTNDYLFGFVEDGAVIKNLTVKGKEAGLAYSVGKDSILSGCVIDSEWTVTNYTEKEWEAREVEVTTYTVAGGAIAYNYGTVENCISYSDGIIGFVGQNYGTVKNCMNLGTVYSMDDEYCDGKVSEVVKTLFYGEDERYICGAFPSALGIKNGISCVDLGNSSYSKADDSLYTLDECIAADGDKSAFADLDFIYTWVMIEGMPYLRLACEGMAGDINFDGTVNAKDANQLKAVLALGIEGHDYRTIASFDVNVDEAINAKDSYVLKQTLAGAN